MNKDYQKQLEKLIERNDGLILTKDVVQEGIPRAYLNPLLKENKLERVAHGVYLTPDAFDDEMYRLQARNKKAIFSHETALFFHDLTDRDPLAWSVTVPYGYNATHLRVEGLKVYTVKKELHPLGLTELETQFGRKIQIYNPERTICDILRNRNNMDISILNDGIKRYLNKESKNIPLLMRYAKKLNVEKPLRKYVEILL